MAVALMARASYCSESSAALSLVNDVVRSFEQFAGLDEGSSVPYVVTV